jgi:hypothetical protein
LSLWRLQAGLSSPALLAATHPELAHQVAALEALLYGTGEADAFDPKTLLTYAEKANRRQKVTRRKTGAGPILPTLYPEAGALERH